MATPNRTTLFTKMHKVLKKHYQPVPPPERPVLEHLLFACCLENTRYDHADQAFQALSTTLFDWNEVRVSTVKELCEVMHMLPDPAAAASNLKRILQSVFESSYSFDLEALRKQGLGQAAGRLKKIEGTTPFAIAYVTQATLGGHAIPLDRGLLEALAVLGAATESDMAEGVVPGLERAIPKQKGVEFTSLAHQLGANFLANPYSPALHKILLEVSPQAKERLPKRPAKTARPKGAVRPAGAAGQAAERAPPGAAAPAEIEAKSAAARKKDAPPRKPAATRKPAPKGATAPPHEKKKTEVVGLAKRKPR